MSEIKYEGRAPGGYWDMNLSNCSLTPENDYFQNRSFCLRTSSASSLYVGYIRIKLRRHGVERFSRYEYSKSLVTKHMCDVTPSRNAQNTISSRYAQTHCQWWTRFMDTKPKAHNTDKDSSARSSHVKSYHLGIWRRSNKEARITKDTCIKTQTRRQCIGREQCLNFMRTVQRAIAPVVRRLMKRYMPDEWKERKRWVVSFNSGPP